MDVFGGAPRFLAYPRPVVVQSGTDAVLKCQIGGDPRPAVIWERNNEKIDPQGRYRVFEDGNVYNLIISSVTAEDTGQYICKAKNSIGETYAAAMLKVEGEAQEMELREENKPRFLIKPLSTRVGRGDDAVFSCKLWGNPRPDVVWEKDGRKLNEIFESTHFSVGQQDGGWFQLKIFKTRAPDGGVYTCKARNEFGEALAGAVLLVDAGPGHEEDGNRNGYTNGHWKAHQGKVRGGRLVSNRLKDDSMAKSTTVKMFAVTEGKHAKFRCFVTGKPKPEIIWRKDGRLILSGRRYLLYEDREGYFTLKVLYCKQKDNGVYVCAASNTAGQTLSAVHLSVKEPPVRFKQPLIDLEVWERDLAVLECEVPEDSVPITWYLEDRRLQPGAKYGMEEWGTKRRLTIRDIGVDDDGIYLCEMPDGGRSIAEVAVKGTIVRKLPRKVDVLEGENAAFCVEVEEEEMDIHWYKDGIELRETHQTIVKSFGRTHILVFVNTMPQDSGLVTFFVGRSKTSSQLRVKSARHCPPSCPVGVQINTERANAALLSWVPAQDTRKNPPSGYVLERQEVGTGSQEWLQCLTTDSATSVEILGDSVPCEADYRFRICSVNKYGKSNNVEFPRAVHLVPVARIQAPLQDALVPEGQDAIFSIELSASVIGTWFLNGTQLQEDERYSMRRSRTHQSLRIRGVRDTDNGAEITFIAYGIRDSAALYIQAPLVKFSPLSEMDRNKFIEVGNPIVLYCELSDPEALVHWYKNGVALQSMEGLHIQSEGTMRRIVIQSAEFSHSGVYCCDAIDDVIRFNVEVEAPPVRFSAIPDAERKKTIQAGCPLVLQCELSDASAQVCWYKDGSKLLPQKGVEILSDGCARTVIVHSADYFHAGVYTCKTKGDTAVFNVEIKAPPVKFSAIPEDMRSKSIEAGCPVVLQCVVSEPEAEVCWYKCGKQLFSYSGLEIHSEGNTRTLVIQSAELSHSGVYTCVSEDDTMEFHVEIKATIGGSFSAVCDIERTKSLEEGKPFELECKVRDPMAQVCWYKDGAKLFPENGFDVNSDGTLRRLVVPSATCLHSGLYSCETADDTIHFAVDIKAPPLSLAPSPEVVETQSLEAMCAFETPCETSDTPVEVLEKMERHHTKREPDFDIDAFKNTLVIEPTHPSNSGAYYCATADDVAQLIVQNQAPTVSNLLGPEVKKSIETSGPIVRQFEISDPIAKACWYKDGTQIYPQRGVHSKSESNRCTLPLQSNGLSCDGMVCCDRFSDVQLDMESKAEQCYSGDESGEVADASAQCTMDVEATPSKLSSDQETEQKSIDDHYPTEDDCLTSNATFFYKTNHCNSPQTISVPHSRQPTDFGQMNRLNYNIQHAVFLTDGLDDSLTPDSNCQTEPVQSQNMYSSLLSEPVHFEELNSTLQSTVKLQEINESFNRAIVQAEELHNSLQTTTFQPEELHNSLQTTTVQPEELHNSLQTISFQSEELHDSLQTTIVQPEELHNSLQTTIVQPEELHNSLQTTTVQSEELHNSLQTTTVQSEELHNSLQTTSVQSDELHNSLQTTSVQSEELHNSLQTTTVQSGLRSSPLQSATMASKEVFNSLETAIECTDAESPQPHNFKMAPIQSEELYKTLQPSVQSAGLCNLLQTTTVQSDDLYHKVHSIPIQLKEQSHSGHATTYPAAHQNTTETTEKLQGTDNSEQNSSAQAPEPYYAKKIPNVQSEDIYLSRSCERHWDDDVIAIKVDVEALPVRITTPCEAERNKCIEIGDPIRLRCEISNPTAEVTWYKNGIELNEANGQHMQSQGSIKTLVIESAMLSHAGIYICKTSNDAMKFLVDVKVKPMKFSAISEADQNKKVMEGCTVILQCELSDPAGQVFWYKNGTKLLPQSGLDIKSDGHLRSVIIHSADLSHSGVYRCETKDDGIPFTLDVKAQPVKFLELPETERNLRVLEGSPIILQCELIDDVTTQVCWCKDGKTLLPTDVEIQSDGPTRRIYIQSADKTHSGTYECSTADDTITFTVDVKDQLVKIVPIASSERFKCVAIGSPIIFQCELESPVAQVSWFKDTVELFSRTGLDMKRDGRFRKLMIHSAKVSDSGLYSCCLDDDAVTFQVDVKATPMTFSVLPGLARNKCIEAGYPVAMQCEGSDATTKVSWHKDGVELLTQPDLDIQSKGKLRAGVMQSAEARHCALYSCEAADDHVEFKVDAAADPDVERSEPHEIGIPNILQTEISEPTKCLYEDEVKLSRFGIDLHSESSEPTHTIQSATSSCSVAYSCKSDDDSDFNDCAEVKALLPVTFANIPEEDLFKSAVEQDKLDLSCEVSRPDAVVQWYKDGVEMQPSDSVTLQADGTRRTLTIHAAQLSDTGTYTCRAGDCALMFKVNIREPPVMIVYPKEDVHLDRHVPEEIILSCELSRPNGVVSWYKDGQKLQDSENIKLRIEGPYRRLKMISSGVEDTGEYVCDTADDSIFFHLKITEPPVLIVSPSQSQMELCQQTSERMVLSCEISRPNAVVRWYRDGLEVEENDNLLLEVDGVYRRLIIPETTVKDSAEYVCDTADDSMTFFVNIAEPPVRFVRPRKTASGVEKFAGETLVLDCEVSRTNAEVTWKKNGEEVEDSRNITILEDGVMRQLTIHSLTIHDAGQYICDAKDDVMDFHVKMKELPVRILGKTDANTEKQFLVSDDIILVCELSRSNVSVSWYKDNQLIDDNERYCSDEQGVFHSLVVLNADLEDAGEYTCDAVEDKMVFYITVKEPLVQIIGNSGNPEHHILLAGDDLILECEVSRPNASVQWLWNSKLLKSDTRVKIDSYDVVRKLVLSGLQPSDSGEYICDAVDDKMITFVEVQEPPVKFVNKQPNVNVSSAHENESVTLCAMLSQEGVNVRWLKDGKLLNKDNIHISSDGRTHNLTINPLQLSDAGEYVCDANIDEMCFTVVVKEMKVKFIRPLENVVALKGSSLILRCEINCPKADVQWLKNGADVPPSQSHTIRAHGRERSFTIHRLVDNDAGEYACESTDARTTATVTVEAPRIVEFIAELHSITVQEGEDASFKCVVSPEDTHLVWRLNGKQVPQNERFVISSNGLCRMLSIHGCQVSDSARVTADAEGLVSEAKLQVQEQQVLFTKHLAPVVAEESSEATLEVELSLDSGEVQWMRQGVLIHPGAKYTLKQKGRKRILTIHKLTISDRGTYSCETLHDRTKAQLTVEPRKITIKRGLTDIRTTERETATFEVELSHANVTGTWLRNGVQLKPTNHWRISAKGQVHSLTISNLAVEDTGTFMFSTENLKTSARLVVKEPPVTFLKKLEDQKFPEGSLVSIECELSRHNVDVKWSKNKVELKPIKDLRIYAMGRKRFLQIMKCCIADSGIYTCDAGEVATSCMVDIYERELLVLQALEDLEINEDQNAVFVCETSVEDVPGEWYKNGEKIQPTSTIKIRQEGTKHFLLMCNVRGEDSGEIKFVARHVESIAYLEVEELPVNIVRPLQDKTAVEMSRVLLDCTVSNPRCSIRWYKGSNVILPSERFEICSEGCYRKLIIQQVALEDEGTYSVQVGDYTCSAKLTVEAQSLHMIQELQDVEVVAPEEACFECEVSVAVVKAAVWSLNGVPLQPGPGVCLAKMGAVHRLTLRQTSVDMSGTLEFTLGNTQSSACLCVLSGP